MKITPNKGRLSIAVQAKVVHNELVFKGEKMAVKANSPRKTRTTKKTTPKMKAMTSTNGRKPVNGFRPTRLKLLRPVPSDIEIAQAGKLKPITLIAEELGLKPGDLELYGPYKAKIKLEVFDRLKNRPDGKYV